MNNLKSFRLIVWGLLLGIVSAGGILAQNAPMSGESFNLVLGNLDPGQTVVITFDVTVDLTIPPNVTQVCNQGLVSGNNFADVLTDDPDVGGGSDPTCTPIVQPPQELDFGDAPDPTYATLLINNGARHVIVPGINLGPIVDSELEGQPTAIADGDDIAGGPDDEDGVILPPVLVAGDPAATVIVDGGPSGGMLDAWIDFNGNGMFDHPSEHLFGGSLPIGAGPNPPIPFVVPATALPGQSFARFRLSNAGGLTPTGQAPDGEVEDYEVQIEEPVIFPFMTIWSVNDDVDGKLQYYTLDISSAFLNIEGDIILKDTLGNIINDDKDLEDLIIDSSSPVNSILPNDGTFYIVNNVGTSTIYKLDFSEFDDNPATPVTATLVGSTGLPSDPGGSSPNEISSLLVFEGTLYGLGKRSKKLYEISAVDGSLTQVFTLNVPDPFRTDGMTYMPPDAGPAFAPTVGTVYLLKTNDSGGESEIWKFDSFPSGDISYVRQIETSAKVEALSAHPDGFLYASDQTTLYKISVTDLDSIWYLADYTVDIEGMDFFYDIEVLIPVAPTRAFIPIAPTPVELVSFTAEAKSSKVILNWETATEVNNYGFEILRRVHQTAGESQNDKWVTLGFVDGHGNSNSPKIYSFSDNNPAGGSKFSYRLKQIDNDGTYEYSQIVEVEFVPTEFALYQNYPNPFNPTTVIKYSIPQESEVTIKVFDILGNEIRTLVSEKQEAGTYEVDFGGSDLVSGIYIYQMQTESFSSTKKMLLMK